MVTKKLPLVSVVMITYGHEKYIQQAIEGVLMQDYEGEIELIIANDCSPDRTDDIIKNSIKNDPRASIIKYTRHYKNIGMIPNFIWALQQAKGSYIALCEGDDYWTEPKKIQIQVDFLEANDKHIVCGHHRKILDIHNNLQIQKSERTSFTQCMVFRNNLCNEFYIYSKKVFNGDTFLQNYLMLKGNLKILDFIGAVYRYNNEGAYSSINEEARLIYCIKTFETFLTIKRKSEFIHYDIVMLNCKNKLLNFYYDFSKLNNNWNFLINKYFRFGIRNLLLFNFFNLKQIVKFIIK